MDDLEFKERLFADPFTEDQDIIAAAANNPDMAQLRLEIQGLDHRLSTSSQETPVPSDLMDKLLAIPATDVSTEAAIATIGQAEQKSASTKASTTLSQIGQSRPVFQYFALAASLVVALGVSFSFLSDNGGPSAAEIAFGEEILNHLRLDTDAVAAMNSDSQIQMQVVNTVLDHAGVQLVSADSLSNNPVKFAVPCVIIPSNQSAHLVIQGNQGAINVIVINNSPVASEFRISDDSRGGIVIPMSDGNLVLVSESDEDLDQYGQLFSENLQWSI